ncbi:MAG: helix-turn-helix domain-containing protein [Desulfuromusa sp.]
MNTSTARQLESSFLSFFETAHRAIEIQTEQDYQFALDLIEHLIEKAEDKEGEPLLHMIDLVADSIEKYEDSFEDMQEFIRAVDALDPARSALRVIIDQHKLTYADLQEEIGSKSLVSQIVNGTKNLTKNHIAKLSERFKISPELFF